VKTDRRAGSQPRLPGAGRGAQRLSLDGVLTTGCDKTTSAYRQQVRLAPGRPDISHRCTGSHHDPKGLPQEGPSPH